MLILWRTHSNNGLFYFLPFLFLFLVPNVYRLLHEKLLGAFKNKTDHLSYAPFDLYWLGSCTYNIPRAFLSSERKKNILGNIRMYTKQV
jgi:hypothetical protein